MRNIRMNRYNRSGRRGPGRRGSLRTDFSEDYDTTDFAQESEDNWDNEGGTFANPDSEYDDYEDDYDDDWEEEFNDDWDEDNDWEKVERKSARDSRAREGSYGGKSSMRKRMMLQSNRSYGNKPSTASRVRYSGISVSKNRTPDRRRPKKKNSGSGLDNQLRYDW